jgi:hypothetical protein
VICTKCDVNNAMGMRRNDFWPFYCSTDLTEGVVYGQIILFSICPCSTTVPSAPTVSFFSTIGLTKMVPCILNNMNVIYFYFYDFEPSHDVNLMMMLIDICYIG